MTEDNETEIYNTIFAQSKKSLSNEKKGKNLQKKSYPFSFYSYSLCRFFCFISQISILFHLSWSFFKMVPLVSFIIAIPASKILVHDLGRPNLDYCSFPVFLVSVPFSSSPSVRIQLISLHVLAVLRHSFFNKTASVYIKFYRTIFYLKKKKTKQKRVSWGKGVPEEQAIATNTSKSKGQIQVKKAVP